MKYLLPSILLSFYILHAYGMTPGLVILHNRFGDALISINSVCKEHQLLYKIKAHDAKGKSYFVDIPYTQGHLTDLLIKKHGFEHYHSDNSRTRLIKRLDVDIPLPFTCNSGAKVVITNIVNGILHVLFTKEKGRLATWPGGMISRNERIFDAALREVKEELNITLAPETLLFLGVLHRTDVEYQATHHQYVFQAPYNNQEIKPDGKEIEQAEWVAVSEILKTGKVFGMPIREHKIKILEALQAGKSGTPCHHLPDFRQQDKPHDEKDMTDIMDFYFATK